MKVKSESDVAQLCPTLSDPMDVGPYCLGLKSISLIQEDCYLILVLVSMFNSVCFSKLKH